MSSAAYSPGLEGVIAGETAVANLDDGLSYRGYAVEELAEQGTYEEVAHLILYGDLPSREQLAAFKARVFEESKIPAEMYSVLKGIPADAPMMDVLRSAASLLAHWDPDVANGSHGANLKKSERLMGQLPVVLAARQRLKQGLEPIAPKPGFGYAKNILYMLRGTDPSTDHAKALDVSLILYGEHGFNASTFTARCCASTLSDLHSAITAAIGALKGPLHGGANERAMEVLEKVSSPATAEAWIRDALARKERIMGFGHRVYKLGDPRAVLLKKLCAKLAKEAGREDLEQIAETIERVVVAEKKLPPNVDWPCARLYHYLGLPVDLYTPLFVIGRTPGWCAHVTEQLDHNRLIRPEQIYIGEKPRSWKPIEQR